MGKREIREQVFKLLFQVEFREIEEMEEMSKLYFDIYSETIDEEDEVKLGEINKTREAASEKLNLILDKLSEIDAMINSKDIGWSIDRFGKVELTLTRLAIYEMKFDEDVPEAVAINEAVELAKKYTSDEGAKFVNGVLAQFATDKNRTTSKGKRTSVKNPELEQKKKRTATILTVKSKKEQ